MLVSDDGQSYFEAGDLVALSNAAKPPPPTDYGLHRFTTDQLKAHGRFVKFVVAPAGAYCFIDEIEVYQGPAASLSLTTVGEPITDAKAHFQTTAVARAIQRRLREDSQAVREAVTLAPLSAQTKRSIADSLHAVDTELATATFKVPADARCTLPLNPLHERVFAAQAALWRAQSAKPLMLWASNPWDPLPLIGPLPAVNSEPVRLNVTMMQNEFRAVSFNLSWAGEQPLIAHLRFAGLPGSPKPNWLSVHEVAWTDTRIGKPVAAALPLATSDADGFRIALQPGLTRQVWITVHSKNLPTGVRRGKLLISAAHQELRVPFTIEVYPIRFPDAPALHLGGWDYTDAEHQYEITPQNRSPVIAHLREHFVDSPWGTAAVIPFGSYDSEGGLSAAPDTTAFDRWLARWPAARQYCIFAAVGGQIADSPIGTPLFEKKVAAWIRFWAAHARRQGLKPEQLQLLLVDEPTEAQQDAIILAWAKAIRAANTGVRIWEDPCHADPAAANQEMMRLCHVLCPNRPSFLSGKPAFRDYYRQMAEGGTELAFYSCSGPARSLDPFSYYRLQAWSCWQFGAKASYFWAFGDGGGGSSWNEYAAKGPGFVPFFLDAESITAGKQMEAIREGVEDYEYLVMLERRIAALEPSGRRRSGIERAKALLREATHRVCDAPGATQMNWADPKDRTIADRARLEILQTLGKLQ